ncbi:alpha/beta hydrolase [Polaribacter sp. Asnod6-C07]|uniref:alpha/beta hydrolase n=1 Tax=Polaribacter sp. Asnod6-C07 TaxID=3160582 RepID=UPI003863A0FC
MLLKDFKKLGNYYKVNNNNVFVIDLGNHKNTVVIISGYPLISYDFHKIILQLSEFYRVVIHDHFGFGLTELPNSYCYSIIDQADVCIKIWKKLNLKEFQIIASNYGDKVAKEILYRSNVNLLPFKITGITISNSSNKDYFVKLKTISKLIDNSKISKYKEVLRNYSTKNFFNNKLLEQKENEKIERIWQKFNEIEGQKETLVLCSFNEENFLYWHRWVKALKDSKIPIKIFWRKDDIANIKDLLLNLATTQPKNVEIIENKKCLVIENNPLRWLLMILKEIDLRNYNSLKTLYINY